MYRYKRCMEEYICRKIWQQRVCWRFSQEVTRPFDLPGCGRMNFFFSPPQLDIISLFCFSKGLLLLMASGTCTARDGGVKSLGGMGVVLTRRTNKCFLTIHLFFFGLFYFYFFFFLLLLRFFWPCYRLSLPVPFHLSFHPGDGVSQNIQGGVYYTQVEDVYVAPGVVLTWPYTTTTPEKRAVALDLFCICTRCFFLLVFSR